MATPPVSTGGGGGLPRNHAHSRAGNLAPDDVGFDEHSNDEDDPQKGRHCACRQLADRVHRDVRTVDLDGAGRRPALTQHLVDQYRKHGAETASDDTAAAAEDRRSADDHRGNHDEFGAEAELRCHTLVLGDCHETRERGAQRRHEIGAHAHPAGRDAGIGRGLLVAASGECLIAPACLGKDDRAGGGNHQEDHDLVVEAEGIRLTDLEKCSVFLGLRGIGDVLAAGEAEHQAAADKEHGQGRNERRHPQYRHQQAVDQPEDHAEKATEQERRGQPIVIVGRREDNRKGDADKPVDRADGQVYVLVDDDKCHAYGHHAVAGGIAQ